jgi:hypothetical protein
MYYFAIFYFSPYFSHASLYVSKLPMSNLRFSPVPAMGQALMSLPHKTPPSHHHSPPPHLLSCYRKLNSIYIEIEGSILQFPFTRSCAGAWRKGVTGRGLWRATGLPSMLLAVFPLCCFSVRRLCNGFECAKINIFCRILLFIVDILWLVFVFN